MKSFSIKTNNEQIINYLLNNLSNIDFDNIYYIKRNFKIYKNVIVHYKGNKINEFLRILTTLITDSILLYYEPILIRKCINFNYFYFDEYEKNTIENISYEHIWTDEDDTLKFRKDEIWQIVLSYISENKFMILDGFVNFRLTDYLNTIDEIVDYSVNKYVIEKEYKEYINLLKIYIESNTSQIDLVNLILYNNKEFILVDKNSNILPIDDNILNSKYVSDITFSNNDYILNTLLTLLPKKIIIHILDYENEFINTLKLIFDDRIFMCTGCDLCSGLNII